MVRIVRGERLTAIGFIAPANRYAEIRAALPKLKNELPSKWRVLRLDLWIQNPVHVPTQAEIHLIAETAKDVAEIAKDVTSVTGLAYAMWCILEKHFPWIKKQTEKKRTRPRGQAVVPKLMTEVEFRRRIHRKYPNHFLHTHALQHLAESAIQNYKNWTSTHYEASLSLIFGRAYKSFDSIRRLCEIASCEDAGVLLRNLLNLLAVTRWISVEPAKRAKRYFDWYWISMKVDADKFSSLVPRSWNPVIQSHFDALRPQFESKGKLVKHWYQPIAMSIRDIFDQADLSKHYEEAYSPLSAIEHSDINTFFAMTQQMEGGGNHRQLAVQSDLFVPHYLRNAFQYFGDIFRICNKTIPLTDGLQLEQTIKAGLAFHKADMQKRGMTP